LKRVEVLMGLKNSRLRCMGLIRSMLIYQPHIKPQGQVFRSLVTQGACLPYDPYLLF
jgi:hypothetical protein